MPPSRGGHRHDRTRRCCWADRTHTMHMRGRPEDFTGIEGPTDPRHIALLAQTLAGEPVAVLHANAAHPTMFYGARFYSADYPGEARQIIRRALGDVPVIYLNGPIGDIAPNDPWG